MSVDYDRLRDDLQGAGFSAATAAATVSKIRALTDRGVVWDTVTGSALLATCPNQTQRTRLRRALVVLHGAPEAHRRWPELFSRFGTRPRAPPGAPKTPTLESTLPVPVLRMAAGHPVRVLMEKLYRRLVKRGGMRTALTYRVALSFLHGFLFATPCSLLPEPPDTPEELLSRLRALSHEEVVRAYAAYRDNGARGMHAVVTLDALCNQLRLVSLLFCDVLKAFKRRVDPADFGILVPRRRCKGAQDDAGSTQASTQSTFSTLGEDGPVVDRSTGWVRLGPGEGPRVHCFNASEVRALYLACDTAFERLLVACLCTTAMRIGGLCLCERPAVVEAGASLRTLEKGNRTKDYPLAPSVAALLPGWFEDGQAGPRYLFPATPGGLYPLPTHAARRAFMAVATRAGLSGSHVKPHTTRHTVAWTLSALGNKLEHIADFVGHRSTQVTNDVYIAMQEAEKRHRMDIPWLNTDAASAQERLQATALELASALAGPFASADGRTFPKYQRPTPSRTATQVRFTVPEAVHDEVTTQSVARAERKASKKAKKEERRAKGQDLMKRSLEECRALFQSLRDNGP